jgi:hypothetical protein
MYIIPVLRVSSFALRHVCMTTMSELPCMNRLPYVVKDRTRSA